MTQKPLTKLTPLQRLLLEHLEATNESLAEVARRGGLPRQTVQAVLYKQGASLPSDTTMAKLAKGLGVDVAVVHQAVAAGLTGEHNENGTTTPKEDPLLSVLLATARELDPSQVEVLVETAKAMLRVGCLGTPKAKASSSRKG